MRARAFLLSFLCLLFALQEGRDISVFLSFHALNCLLFREARNAVCGCSPLWLNCASFVGGLTVLLLYITLAVVT